jgi:hypothetical protein
VTRVLGSKANQLAENPKRSSSNQVGQYLDLIGNLTFQGSDLQLGTSGRTALLLSSVARSLVTFVAEHLQMSAPLASARREKSGAPGLSKIGQNRQQRCSPAMTATAQSLSLVDHGQQKTRRSKAEIDRLKSEIVNILDGDRPMTVRQVFYQLVVRGLIDKTEQEYMGVVVRLLTEMRISGDVPFSWWTQPIGAIRSSRQPSTPSFSPRHLCLSMAGVGRPRQGATKS